MCASFPNIYDAVQVCNVCCAGGILRVQRHLLRQTPAHLWNPHPLAFLGLVLGYCCLSAVAPCQYLHAR